MSDTNPAVPGAVLGDDEVDPHWAADSRERAALQCDRRIPHRFTNAVVTDPGVAAWVRAVVEVVRAERRTAPRIVRGPSLMLVGSTGVGKCLAADTVVYDPDTGLPQRIKDVVREGACNAIWSLADRRDIVTLPITARVDSGMQPTLTVRTATGRSVTTTKHHPFLTPDGWTDASAISIGQTVAIPARVPAPRHPVVMSGAEIDMVALLLAEGACTGSSIKFSTADPVMLDRAVKSCAELGMTIRLVGKYSYLLCGIRTIPPAPPGTCGCGCGAATTVSSCNDRTLGYVKGEPKRYVRGHHARRGVAPYLVKKHDMKKLARDKSLPVAIYQLSDLDLRRFLSVFWMCDGSVERSGPSLTLASKALIDGIQHLLLRLGIQSSVRPSPKRFNSKLFQAWRLTVFSQSRVVFAENLNLWGEKARRAQALAEQPVRVSRMGAPSMSPVLHARMKAVARHPALAGVRVSVGNGGARPGEGSVNRVGLGLLAPHARDLAALASPDVFWDRVVAVDDAGVQQVYDLTVEPTASFVANDIVVHNTHEAYGAIRALSVSGAGCSWLFTTAADLYGALRPRPRVDSEDEFDRFARVGLLVLDDFGAAKTSEWNEEINYRLINYRYERELPTLITSNVPPKDLPTALGERVASRVAEMAERVVLRGGDRRVAAAASPLRVAP